MQSQRIKENNNNGRDSVTLFTTKKCQNKNLKISRNSNCLTVWSGECLIREPPPQKKSHFLDPKCWQYPETKWCYTILSNSRLSLKPRSWLCFTPVTRKTTTRRRTPHQNLLEGDVLEGWNLTHRLLNSWAFGWV